MFGAVTICSLFWPIFTRLNTLLTHTGEQHQVRDGVLAGVRRDGRRHGFLRQAQRRRQLCLLLLLWEEVPPGQHGWADIAVGFGLELV